MIIKGLIKSLLPTPIRSYFGMGVSGIGKYAFDKRLDVRVDIERKYHFKGDLVEFFAGNRDHIIHKWHHYIPLYDRYFSRFRGSKLRFLEIGVSEGGSLQVWRKYFGPDAIIFGIDIDPNCRKLNGLAGQVRIGSQDDTGFLESVVKEMGGIDIVLDDGSHQMGHILASLQYLFPKVSDGGVYMIEDLHTAYWREFGGGFGVKQNFFRFVGELVNDMHHWYHANARRHPAICSGCTGVHIHDSLVVLDKNPVFEPTHSKIG